MTSKERTVEFLKVVELLERMKTAERLYSEMKDSDWAKGIYEEAKQEYETAKAAFLEGFGDNG